MSNLCCGFAISVHQNEWVLGDMGRKTVLKLFQLFYFSFISHVRAAEMKLKYSCFVSVLFYMCALLN